MTNDKKAFKILVLVYPTHGHLIPMTCLVSELTKRENVKVYFPSSAANKSLIERINAEFVDLQYDYGESDESKIFRLVANHANHVRYRRLAHSETGSFH